MANPTCTAATLGTDAACYQEPCLNPQQQLAMLVAAKAYELKGIGGTDYTGALNSTLVSDAVAVVDDDTSKFMGIAINTAWVNAAKVATVPETVALKLAAANCISCADERTLKQILLWLECQLGVHKAYAQ